MHVGDQFKESKLYQWDTCQLYMDFHVISNWDCPDYHFLTSYFFRFIYSSLCKETVLTSEGILCVWSWDEWTGNRVIIFAVFPLVYNPMYCHESFLRLPGKTTEPDLQLVYAWFEMQLPHMSSVLKTFRCYKIISIFQDEPIWWYNKMNLIYWNVLS